MLERLLPHSLDNTYRGHTIALWLFGLVALMKSAQSLSIMFAGYSTASGAGWHVTFTLPDLVNGDSVIAASTMTMAAPTVTPSGGADPTNVVGHASTGNFAAGEKIVTASAGNGSGTYLVSPEPVFLTVPVTARAGVYVSAATLSIVSGP